MPYLICPACRLEAYSAAAHASPDRCSRCDASLGRAWRSDGIVHRWKVTDLRMAARQEEAHDGLG